MKRSTVLAVLAVVIACAPKPKPSEDPGPPASASTDTAFGRVESIGADPDTWLALVQPGVGVQLRLDGAIAPELGAVTGAEVWLRGTRHTGGFRVDSYQVRRVNGQPVDDGTVVVAATTVHVQTAPGVARLVPNAPPSLRELHGARIWITRPVEGVAPSYGLIKAR